MPTYDYIYGSRIIIQCKEYIYIHPWDSEKERIYSQYLKIINMGDDFFDYWCKPKTNVKCRVRAPPKEEIKSEFKMHVGTEIDDELNERNRVVGWTKEEAESGVVPRGGHRGQNLPLGTSFCAKDQGLSFRLPGNTSI